MPNIVDSAATSANESTGINVNVTSSGSDRGLYAAVMGWGADLPTGVLAGATPMGSPIATRQDVGETFTWSLYKLLNQPTGAPLNIAATFAAPQLWSFLMVVTVDDIDQSTGNRTVANAAVGDGNPISADAESQVGDLILDFLVGYVGASALTPGAGQTAYEEYVPEESFGVAGSSKAGEATDTTMSWAAIAGSWTQFALALIPAGGGGGAPTITSVDSDDVITSTQTNWNIVGTGFDTAEVDIIQGAVTVAQDVNSQDATTINCDTVFDGGATDLKYGTATLRVTNGDASFDEIEIDITAPSGRSFVDLSTPNAEAANRITAVPDLAAGDQLEISSVVGGSIGDVTVNPDATFDCDELVTSFTVRAWDEGDATWGAPGIQTITGDIDPPSFTGPIPNQSYTQNEAITPVSLGAYFTEADSFALNQALPDGLAFDTGTGILSGTPTESGTFDGYIVTGSNGGGSTDSNSFRIDIATDQEFASGSGRKRDRRRRGMLTMIWGRG
jgi:hypothetical protein